MTLLKTVVCSLQYLLVSVYCLIIASLTLTLHMKRTTCAWSQPSHSSLDGRFISVTPGNLRPSRFTVIVRLSHTDTFDHSKAQTGRWSHQHQSVFVVLLHPDMVINGIMVKKTPTKIAWGFLKRGRKDFLKNQYNWHKVTIYHWTPGCSLVFCWHVVVFNILHVIFLHSQRIILDGEV